MTEHPTEQEDGPAEEKAEKSSADRKHEIFLLVLGFVLTTVFGTFLTFGLDQVNKRREAREAQQAALSKRAEDADDHRRRRDDLIRDQQLQLTESRRTQASALFDQLSELMDTRLQKWRVVAWALERGDSESSIRAAYADYRNTLQRWNYTLNRNRALACRFFGREAGLLFEAAISDGFRALHDELLVVMRKPRGSRGLTDNALAGKADPLNNVIYQFNDMMAEAIRNGTVGETSPGAACAPARSSDTQGAHAK